MKNNHLLAISLSETRQEYYKDNEVKIKKERKMLILIICGRGTLN